MLHSYTIPSRWKRFQQQLVNLGSTFFSIISSLFHISIRLIHSIVDRILPRFRTQFYSLIEPTLPVFKYIWSIIIINAQKLKGNYREQASGPGLCGLLNIGNTCYMNSAIQCLSNVPSLTKWAVSQQISVRNKNVTQAYISLLQLMWSGRKTYVQPQALKEQMSKYAPIFSGSAQNDAHEFINCLLNALRQESQDDNSNTEQQSIVDDLFRIKTESRVTCTNCNTCDSTDETTYCLPLPLDDEPTDTLEELLIDFLEENPLSGQYYCLTCQALKMAKQQTSICYPLPPVIIVQLKRFTYEDLHDKLQTFVQYPLTDWNVMGTPDGVRYNLISVIMHIGNLKNGHYTTFARLDGDGSWYHFNDEYIEPVFDIKEIINQNAYILIYSKK